MKGKMVKTSVSVLVTIDISAQQSIVGVIILTIFQSISESLEHMSVKLVTVVDYYKQVGTTV